MSYTNVAPDDAALFMLVCKGYGSLDELEQWDTPRLLDVLEYESIKADIEHYYTQER